jgi:hypothetical protein
VKLEESFRNFAEAKELPSCISPFCPTCLGAIESLLQLDTSLQIIQTRITSRIQFLTSNIIRSEEKELETLQAKASGSEELNEEDKPVMVVKKTKKVFGDLRKKVMSRKGPLQNYYLFYKKHYLVKYYATYIMHVLTNFLFNNMDIYIYKYVSPLGFCPKVMLVPLEEEQRREASTRPTRTRARARTSKKKPTAPPKKPSVAPPLRIEEQDNSSPYIDGFEADPTDDFFNDAASDCEPNPQVGSDSDSNSSLQEQKASKRKIPKVEFEEENEDEYE